MKELCSRLKLHPISCSPASRSKRPEQVFCSLTAGAMLCLHLRPPFNLVHLVRNPFVMYPSQSSNTRRSPLPIFIPIHGSNERRQSSQRPLLSIRSFVSYLTPSTGSVLPVIPIQSGTTLKGELAVVCRPGAFHRWFGCASTLTATASAGVRRAKDVKRFWGTATNPLIDLELSVTLVWQGGSSGQCKDTSLYLHLVRSSCNANATYVFYDRPCIIVFYPQESVSTKSCSSPSPSPANLPANSMSSPSPRSYRPTQRPLRRRGEVPTASLLFGVYVDGTYLSNVVLGKPAAAGVRHIRPSKLPFVDSAQRRSMQSKVQTYDGTSTL